eukprot:538983-Amphidinium_carterae.1
MEKGKMAVAWHSSVFHTLGQARSPDCPSDSACCRAQQLTMKPRSRLVQPRSACTSYFLDLRSPEPSTAPKSPKN